MTERNETKFKFLQIPVEILFQKGPTPAETLTPMEKFIWARVDSLSKGRHQACTASNEWLANEFTVTPRWVSESISKMTKLGLIHSEYSEDEFGTTKRKLWCRFPSESSLKGGRSLRGASPQPGGSGTPTGVKTPPQLGENSPPKVPPSITAKQYSEKDSENGAGEKSLQTERETLSDSPPKAGTEAWNHFVRPTGMSDSDYLTLCQSLTQNPATMVEQVSQILAKNAKTNPHTFGYENQKTIASRCRKAVLHKAILTGEVGLAELKTKRKTKKESK